ncbi:sensor histidine kinase [Pedobacter sp. PWIIR3]
MKLTKHSPWFNRYIGMTFNYRPLDGFPYGANIHLAYGINTRQLFFLHDSLNWVIDGKQENPIAALLSKIEPEDLKYLQDNFNSIAEGNFHGDLKFKLKSANGTRWFQAYPFLTQLEDASPLILATIVDITKDVVSMQSIAKFTDKKNSILHMLGHDLRGPLNVAKSLTKSLNTEISDSSVQEKTKYVSIILQQSIDLIGDLISRELMETTAAQLAKERIDIVLRIKDYLEESLRSAPLAELSFEMLSTDDKIFIKLDDAKFMQILNNLMSNAMKFTPPGGKITVSISQTENEVQIEFKDNGIGIPENLLPQIFDKFTDARRTGLQGEPTIGLGLSIVKTIVDWHQGSITCKSKEQEGTTFLITLPKALVN